MLIIRWVYMQLISMSVTNFQAHKQLTVQFSPGTNLIVGPNWSGKTTLQRAILYALFGSAVLPIRQDQLVSFGESRFEVELVTTTGRIVRRRNTATAFLAGQTDPEAHGHAPVTALVEQWVGLTARQFATLRTTRQGEAAALLDLSASKLGEFINQITGVDLVDRVAGRAKQTALRLKGALDAQQPVLERLSLKTTEQRDLHAQLAEVRTELIAVQAQWETAQESAEQAKAYAQQMQALRAQADQIGIQRNWVLSQLGSLERERDSLQDTADVPAGLLDQAEAVWNAARQRTQQAEQALNLHLSSAQQQQRLRGRLESLQGYQQERQAALALFQERPDLEAAVQQAAEARGKVLQAQEQELALRQAYCGACGRPFENQQDQVAQHEAVRQALPDLQASLKLALARQQEVQALHERYSNHHLALSELAGQIGATQRELDQITLHTPPDPDEVQNATTAEQAARQHLEQIRRQAAEVTARRERMNSLQERIEQASIDLEVLRPPEDAPSDEQLAQAIQVAEEWQAWKARIHGDQVRCTTSIAHLELRQAQLDAELEELARQVTQLKQDRSHLERVSRLSKYLQENRDRFTQSVWGHLLGYASTLIAHATSNAITGFQRSGDGEFLYLEHGRLIPVELASGMQQAIMATALKLALSAALGGPCKFMLFDEITAAARNETSLVLTGLLGQTGEQVILITHRPEDAASADHIISLEAL